MDPEWQKAFPQAGQREDISDKENNVWNKILLLPSNINMHILFEWVPMFSIPILPHSFIHWDNFLGHLLCDRHSAELHMSQAGLAFVFIFLYEQILYEPSQHSEH